MKLGSKEGRKKKRKEEEVKVTSQFTMRTAVKNTVNSLQILLFFFKITLIVVVENWIV